MNVDRTRVLAYTFGGLFAAFGGLALTSTTGIGSPLSGNFYTLTSVAAVVIGGISLAGGKGGLFGPIVAAFILSAAVTVLVFAGVDANYGQVIQGALIVLMVMLGGLLLRRRGMSVAAHADDDPPPRASDRIKTLIVDQPLIMLGAILVLLVIACTIKKPSYFSGDQAGAVLRYAAPLAIMAAGQTIAMLTRGIDLSMGATATAAAYVMASNASDGTVQAIAMGLAVGLAVGLVNGIGVGIFLVQPLIMTLGMAGIVTGLLTVQASGNRLGGTNVPDIVRTVGGESLVGFVPNSLVMWTVVSVVVILALRRSGFGRMLYAYGNNPTAMRMAGMRAWQLLLATYVLAGLLAAISGILLAGLINAADLGLANSLLLPSVAAAVIGGTSIFGGIGTYSGTIMGALILTVLDSFLTLLNADDSYRQIIYGLIILALVTLYAQVQRRA